MRTFLLLRPKYEQAIRRNYAQILGESPDSTRVKALTRRMALNHGRYWIDFFYWSERDGELARQAISTVENLEALMRCWNVQEVEQAPSSHCLDGPNRVGYDAIASFERA